MQRVCGPNNLDSAGDADAGMAAQSLCIEPNLQYPSLCGATHQTSSVPEGAVGVTQTTQHKLRDRTHPMSSVPREEAAAGDQRVR